MPAATISACDFVVFGGTGDLAMRKLLPALYLRDQDGQLPDDFRVIGVSRSGLGTAGYRGKVEAELRNHVPTALLASDQSARFLRRLHYVSADADGPGDWAALVELLDTAPGRVRVFYLACASGLYGAISRALAARGLVNPQTRVVLEKPIGVDLTSAREINDEVGAIFSEFYQIFRIDHYLGKETVQNLLVLRFANVALEPLWNTAMIDHIQISVSESIGVGARADYYDGSGALRDMIQNHLLQLLCLVAMEPPSSVANEGVRDEKLKVLRALQPMTASGAGTRTVRGQYTTGLINGQPVPAYREELDGAPSRTETFVAVKAEVHNMRWRGTPFYLRTGKRLDRHRSEIVVVFKAVPHSILPGIDAMTPNRLVIRLQPDDGLRLYTLAKEPGPGGIRLRPVSLDLTFAEQFSRRAPDAYERLLMDVVRGNPTLFMRRDEVEAAWAWTESIIHSWQDSCAPLMQRYRAGAAGPPVATELIERDGRRWHHDMAS